MATLPLSEAGNILRFVWPDIPHRFQYLEPAYQIYGWPFRSSAEVDDRASAHDPGFAILSAAYNEGRRRRDKSAVSNWIKAHQKSWYRSHVAMRLHWLLTAFSCKGFQTLEPFRSFEFVFENEIRKLDPFKIPEGMAFMRGHIPRWGFLIDQNDAGAFISRASESEKAELTAIVQRFWEPAIATAFEIWFRSEKQDTDERWWVGRVLTVADDLGLRGLGPPLSTP